MLKIRAICRLIEGRFQIKGPQMRNPSSPSLDVGRSTFSFDESDQGGVQLDGTLC